MRQITFLVVFIALFSSLIAAWLYQSHFNSSPPPSSSPTTPPSSQPSSPLASTNSQPPQQTLLELAQAIDHITSPNQATVLLPQLQQLVKTYPSHAPSHRLLATLFITLDDIPQAYTHLHQSLQLDPLQPDLHLLAATLAMKLQLWDQAQSSLETAIAQQPDNEKPRLLLAQLHLNQQNPDRAKNILLAILRKNSQSHQAYVLLADIFSRQNKIPLALEQLDKAITCLPPSDSASKILYTRQKSAILRRDNRPADALQILQSLPANDRLQLPLLDDQALCFAQLNQPLQAAHLYDSRLLLYPTDDLAAARAAHWYLKADDKPSARQRLDLLRSLNPQSPAINDLAPLLP